MIPLATVRRAPAVARLVWRLARGRRATASVNLLNRCNQACPMCQVRDGPDVAPSLDDLDRAVRALRSAGIRVLELSGGEPFLRSDLGEVLALLDARRALYTLNTNGTAVDDAALAALRGARGLLQVAVSLDSLDRDRYRLLRGRDLLERAIEGIDRLRGARLGAPLKVNFAMSRHNEEETPAVLEFARRRGTFLSVFPVNQGPGAHRSQDGLFDASPEDRERMARRFADLARLRRRGEPLWEPSAFYETAAAFLRRERLPACGAGALFLDVRADGSVAPCVDLPAVATVEDLAAGRAEEALRSAAARIAACREQTPCCYTCTAALAETGRRPLRWALETARVLAMAAWRARAPDGWSLR